MRLWSLFWTNVSQRWREHRAERDTLYISLRHLNRHD